MRRAAPRHARPSSLSALQARRLVGFVGAVTLSAAGVVVGPAALPGTAATDDPCLAPQVSDVMINQGVASYEQLARGKTTLVKYFLRLPGCAPEGASIQITGGTLFVSSGTEVPLTAALPLPPIGVATTSPIPSAASDPLFVVDGEDVVPDPSGRIAFIAELEYTATVPGSDPVADSVQVQHLPGTSTPVSAVLAPEVKPLRVLVVPMGDAGTTKRPIDPTTQFPDAAKQGVQRGMISLSRQLPVPDSNGENLFGTNNGLRYSINGGLLNLGEHLENGVPQNYMPDGEFCGDGINSIYVASELQRLRTAWNSVNPTGQADFALGQVWQDISRGQTTHPGSSCADGYAHINAKQSWGRVVISADQKHDVTGAIAGMEIVHNLGMVSPEDPRHGGGFHSKNVEADVTAPDRAWNILDQTWLALDRSTMNYSPTGWHGSNTVLEKEDWTRTQCVLVNGGDVTSTCGVFGGLGTSAAGASTDAGSFFISGSTDGTPAGTDAHTYRTDGGLYDQPVDSSEYRFVQRDLSGAVVKDSGLSVGTRSDNHHAPGGNGEAGHSQDGVFGTQFPADTRTEKIQLWKGAPDATGSVLLFERVQNAAPQLLSVSAADHSVTVSASDETPHDLRLDLFVACPTQVSPLGVAVRPSAVIGSTATFVTSYDTRLSCPQGELLVRVTDGVQTATQQGAATTPGGAGSAAIYVPTTDAVTTQFEPVALSGSGRDALDQPAARLVWSMQGPSDTAMTDVAEGANARVTRQEGFAPGTYSIRLRAFDANGVPLGESTTALTVLPDEDRERVPDPIDLYCDGTSAAADPRNATADSDGDGRADVVDTQPCDSSSTLGVRFRPDSLQTSSSGVPVTLEISSSTVDLTTLTADQLYVTQIAGFPTRVPVLSYRPSAPGLAEVKVSRDLLTSFFVSKDLVGYTPVFVGTLDQRLKGADPQYPVVFP